MAIPNFLTGSKNDVGTTAAPITSDATNAKRGIQIVADPNNTVSNSVLYRKHTLIF